MSEHLSVVIPVYADDKALSALLRQLKHRGFSVVVVDGASSPMIRGIVDASGYEVRYLPSSAGRGQQIALAIAEVQTPWVWVLHADSLPSEEAFVFMQSLTHTTQHGWGRFCVAIPQLRLVAFMMNLRSRLTKICTGDQGMFFAVPQLVAIGGFPAQPLMEDIEVSRQLKKARFPFLARPETVLTSPRRWLRRGTIRTILQMWWYRLRYFLGADAHTLFEGYYSKKS